MNNKIFAIFKNNDKKNENHPDYNISFKVNDKYINIGGCWIREGKSGKFFSCKLSNGYKEIKGFHIERDTDLSDEDKEFLKYARENENNKVKNDIKPEEAPF